MTKMPVGGVVGAGALGLSHRLPAHRSGRPRLTVIERDRVAGASSRAVGRHHRDAVPGPARDRDPGRQHALLRGRSSARARSRSRATDTCASGIGLPTWRRSRGASRCSGRSASPTAASSSATSSRGSMPDMRCDDLAGGLFGPSDGYIDGHLYCAALAAGVTARGGRVLQGTSSSAAIRCPAIGTGCGRTAATSSATSWSMPRAAGPAASATSSARRSRSCRNGTRR